MPTLPSDDRFIGFRSKWDMYRKKLNNDIHPCIDFKVFRVS